jgi:hypothetical protein
MNEDVANIIKEIPNEIPVVVEILKSPEVAAVFGFAHLEPKREALISGLNDFLPIAEKIPSVVAILQRLFPAPAA